MHKTILDTDIGTDVDDLLTLAFLLACPEVELLGVSAAYGDTRTRAKMVYRVLELAGRTDIPVAYGDPQTLHKNRPIFWPGHEGKNAGVDELSDSVLSGQSSVDLILSSIRAHPGEVVLCAVAPLVNVAQALLRDPETMQKVKHVYMMGGTFCVENPKLSFPLVEHNFRCDPEAARVVFDSDLPITLFPLDVTLKTPFTKDDLERLRTARYPLNDLVTREIEDWLGWIKARFGRDYCHLHDPLTAAVILDPAIVTRSVPTALKIECQGEFTAGFNLPDPARPANVNVVTEVDLSRFYELFMGRMTHPVPRRQVAN